MVLEQFSTIKKEVEAEITVKKSQFIANVYPISSESEFKEKVNLIKRKYKDARHHVFAYRLSNGFERYSDDGEPAGTAGIPILDILRGTNLYDVAVIVTRYFGGTLLGTGGLVRAYSDATKLAMDKVEIMQKFLAVQYKLEIPYNDFDVVQHYCSTNGFIITDSSFSDMVVLQIIVKSEDAIRFVDELKEKLEGKVEILKVRDSFYI